MRQHLVAEVVPVDQCVVVVVVAEMIIEITNQIP